MDDLLYLTRKQVTALLPSIRDQIDMGERTYRAMAAGDVELPPKPGIHPRPNAFIHAMPAYLRSDDLAAIKWVSGYPDNHRLGLPYISGLIIVNDAATGFPTAIMDAAEITAARTAAASGVCMRKWAHSDWDQVAILGCGEQGRRHAAVVSELKPSATIRTYDPDPERAAALLGRVETHPDPRSAVEGAQVVITAGPILDEPDPPIDESWIGDEYLLLPIDFSSYIDAGPVNRSELFVVDDVGQFEYYRTQGHFHGWPKPRLTVGQAIDSGETLERITACNLGVGALDVAFAAEVLQRARDKGVGTRLET